MCERTDLITFGVTYISLALCRYVCVPVGWKNPSNHLKPKQQIRDRDTITGGAMVCVCVCVCVSIYISSREHAALQ